MLQRATTFANCYISKPVDLDQFVRVVRSIKDFWLGIVVLPASNSWNRMNSKPIHVLLIEDHPGNVRLLRECSTIPEPAHSSSPR